MVARRIFSNLEIYRRSRMNDLQDSPDDLQSSPSDIVSLTELCRSIPCSRPTAMNYIALGMPYVTKASRDTGTPWEFSLTECREWLADYASQKQAQHEQKLQEQEEDAGIVAARIAKLNVETERLQLRLARERGELVPIEKVAEIVEGQMTTLRTHLLALPIKLAPILTGQTDQKAIKDMITSYIREALEELAEDKVLEGVAPEINEDVVHPPDKPSRLDQILEIADDSIGN